MIKSIIKKFLNLRLRHLKVLKLEEINESIGLNIECLNEIELIDKGEFSNNRRDIGRINTETQFHHKWIKNNNAEIRSPITSNLIKSEQSYAIYIDTYHCIIYEYYDQLRFYLLIGDYWFEKLGLFIPDKNLLIIKRDPTFNIKELITLLPILKLKNKYTVAGKSIIILYHDHLAHHILNELTGIDKLVKNKLIKTVDKIYFCNNPIGKLEEIFPEIESHKFVKLNRKQINNITVTENGNIFPFQTSSISESIINRINKFLLNNLNSESEQIIKKTKLKKDNLYIWISIRTENRILKNQIKLLELLARKIKNEGKSIIYLIDGYSKPYELSKRDVSNFREKVINEKKLINEMKNNDIDLIDLTAKPIQEVLSLTKVCDFYICHSGTLHHKISWLQDIPGIIHSNEYFSSLPDNLLPGMTEKEWIYPPARIPVELIKDIDNNTLYTQHNPSNKFNNYELKIDETVFFIIDKLRKEQLI